jgi:hypothetical protein
MKTLLCLPVPVLLFLTACGSTEPEGPPPVPIAEARAQAEVLYAPLAKIADNFPALDTLEQRACETKPTERAGISWNHLMAALERTPDPLPTVIDQAHGVKTPLDKLPAKADPEGTSKDYLAAAEDYASSSHIVVVRMAGGKGPETSNPKKPAPFSLANPDRNAHLPGFKGGSAAGWLVVFDTSTQQPVCQWPFQAQSSETVSMQTGGSNTREEAMQWQLMAKMDFWQNLAGASQRALHEMGAK